MKRNSRGFTLAELLIVVAIIILLLMFALINFRLQIQRGRDAQRKTDLAKIQRAYEEYYNDKGCYPPFDILSPCGGDQMSHWGLPRMLCDPETKQPYTYLPILGNSCAGYTMFTNLKDTSDIDIARVGCASGCGPDGLYNYGVSSGIPLGRWDTMIPVGEGNYACERNGSCAEYLDPGLFGCPMRFPDSSCGGGAYCGEPRNRCEV